MYEITSSSLYAQSVFLVALTHTKQAQLVCNYVIVIVLLLFKGDLIVISWGSSFGSEDGSG
jgi:hypothetical protein